MRRGQRHDIGRGTRGRVAKIELRSLRVKASSLEHDVEMPYVTKSSIKSGIVGPVKRDLGGRMAALFLDLPFDTKSKNSVLI